MEVVGLGGDESAADCWLMFAVICIIEADRDDLTPGDTSFGRKQSVGATTGDERVDERLGG